MSDAPAPDLLTRLGSALAGQYRIERVLGQGGMGTVVLAQDISLDRPVAIKVISPEVGTSEEFLNMWADAEAPLQPQLREARESIARLKDAPGVPVKGAVRGAL